MKKILSVILSVAMLTLILAFPASAATATGTLNKKDVSAWTGSLTDTQISLITAINYDDSDRKVYFDFKYFDGSGWKKDKNAAGLDVDTQKLSIEYSSSKDYAMSWIVQINTFNCWYTGGHAYAVISD